MMHVPKCMQCGSVKPVNVIQGQGPGSPFYQCPVCHSVLCGDCVTQGGGFMGVRYVCPKCNLSGSRVVEHRLA